MDTIINEHTRIQYTLAGSEIANLVGLSGADIRKGATRFGVAGTFTDDADATDNDILLDKTAYVNGQKVTGTLEVVDAISIDNSDNTDTNLMLMDVGDIPSVVVGADINDLYGAKEVVEDGVGLEIIAPQSQFADVIGLTANKIKSGETILGVTGTAQTIKTYATQQDMEQALYDGEIDSGDFVLCEYTYTFYIAETNAETGDTDLIRLIREYETITPEEYVDDVALVDEILGEEESE